MNPLNMNQNQLDQAACKLAALTKLALETVDSPAENEKRKFFAIDAFRRYQAYVAAGFDVAQALYLVGVNK